MHWRLLVCKSELCYWFSPYFLGVALAHHSLPKRNMLLRAEVMWAGTQYMHIDEGAHSG